MRIVIQNKSFSPEQQLGTFARGGAVGAMASFVGYCRGESSGKAVDYLELEHFPGLTESEISRLAETVRQHHNLIDLLIIHRVGAIAVGEAIVLVAAVSAHRAEALAAVSEMMDYLKSEAPIWKKEIGPSCAKWVEPTENDYRAVARWRSQDSERSRV